MGTLHAAFNASGGECDRRMVDVRLDALPQDQPWSLVGWRLVCKQCGTADSVNITPNWHDMKNVRVAFSTSRNQMR
jgi:hypothetical protein